MITPRSNIAMMFRFPCWSNLCFPKGKEQKKPLSGEPERGFFDSDLNLNQQPGNSWQVRLSTVGSSPQTPEGSEIGVPPENR